MPAAFLSTVAWLTEGIGELASVVQKAVGKNQLHESVETLAWPASLANQLGGSLDDAVARYSRLP